MSLQTARAAPRFSQVEAALAALRVSRRNLEEEVSRIREESVGKRSRLEAVVRTAKGAVSAINAVNLKLEAQTLGTDKAGIGGK